MEMRNGIIEGNAGDTSGGGPAGPKRMANLELLRCAAMMMVVVLHYLGKGGLLADLTKEHLSGAELTAWLLECFCAVAVNVYMILSGYFLCMSPRLLYTFPSPRGRQRSRMPAFA